jgi:hypothetical protein
VIRVMLAVIGVTTLIVGSRQLFVTLRDGSFRARGNRLIRRKSHPIMFWMNFGALSFVSVIGAALITWAWLITN